MALKKKGTPSKIEVVSNESALEQWEKINSDSLNEPIIYVAKDKKKNKKNKS